MAWNLTERTRKIGPGPEICFRQDGLPRQDLCYLPQVSGENTSRPIVAISRRDILFQQPTSGPKGKDTKGGEEKRYPHTILKAGPPTPPKASPKQGSLPIDPITFCGESHGDFGHSELRQVPVLLAQSQVQAGWEHGNCLFWSPKGQHPKAWLLGLGQKGFV